MYVVLYMCTYVYVCAKNKYRYICITFSLSIYLFMDTYVYRVKYSAVKKKKSLAFVTM